MADYDYRPGVVNTLGIDFETQMMAYIAAASCNRTDLKDFWIASNVDGVGAWDDIILFTETVEGDKNLQFIQLKHKEITGYQISINAADFKKDILKYSQDYEIISALMLNEFPIKHNQYKIKDILKGTNVPFEDMEFILMSNATYVDKSTQIKPSTARNSINDDYYTLGPVSKKPSNIMTNQGGAVNTISSNTSGSSSLNLEFTKQVFIVSEQTGVKSNDLFKLITMQLKQFISYPNFKYDLKVAKYLVAKIKNWFPENKRILCKDDIKEIISNGILNTSKHTKPISNACIKLNTKEWEIFKKLIEPFQLVVFSNGNLILQNLFDTDASHYFINCNESDIDFVINCLKVSKTIKIILFLPKTSIDSIIENQIAVSTLNSLNTMSENLLALLFEYSLMFHGKETTFQTLLNSNPYIKTIFTVDDITRLLANKLSIGQLICDVPIYYVPRTMPRIFVNKSIIFKNEKSFFILLVNDDSEYATLTTHSFWQTKSRDMRSKEQAVNKEIIERNYSIVFHDSLSENLLNVKSKFSTVHTLKYYKYKDQFILEWVSSTNNIQELYNFIEKEQFDIDPIGDNLTGMHLNYKNGFVITANPGMGKTYYSKHLANIFSVDSKFWAVFISLNELNFVAVNHFQACLRDYEKTLNITDKQIFGSYLVNKSVVILFDGFDEIAPTNVEEALRIIKEVYALGLKIVVTSREVTRELLVESLNLLSYTLEPFTTSNKLNFLENYFLYNLTKPDNLEKSAFGDKIKQFSLKLLGACSLSNWDEDFTGIPLQCKLLAEGFENECQSYCQTGEDWIITNKINLITLYENFIENKFNICIEEKEKIEAKGSAKNKIIKTRKNEFLEKHMMAAVQLIFPQFGIKMSEEFLEEIKNGEDKFGLITRIDENNNPVFLHRTFAEYFAAKWLVKIKERKIEVDESKREEYLKFLLEPQNNVVHDLFDKLICADCELHIAVLNGDTTNVKEILKKNGGCDEGKCGRTALHLLAARGAKHEREDGRIRRKGEEKYAETLKVLLENCVCCDEEDQLFRWTPLQFSNYRNAFGVINLLLENQRNRLYNLENAFIEKWDKVEILQMCAEFDYVNVGTTFVDLKTLESNETEELLKTCAENDSVRFAEKLIDCNELNTDELSKMTFKYGNWYKNGTLLHVAAEKGNVEMLVFLLQYIDVDIKDEDGRTALWIPCKEGRLSTVKALLERNAQLFLEDKEGRTPMDEAVWSGNVDLAKYVTNYEFLKIGFGDDVNATLPSIDKGTTALHFAAMGNNLFTIEKLLSEGANVNITMDVKWTGLHLAFISDNLSIATKLVENGGNLFLANIDGETPMDFALKYGNKETLEYVTSYDVLKIGFGEDVNFIFGKNKCTALHLAAIGNNLSTIERLISNGANLNIVDKNGQSVLHYGSTKGHLSVVKELLSTDLHLFLKDNDGQTPMDLAMESKNRELIEYVTSYDVLKKEFGGDVNAELSGKDEDRTALHFAALANNLSTVKELISNGANVNITDMDGNTLLQRICKGEWTNSNIVQFLVESDLNINAENHRRETALHLAVEEGKTELVKMLVELEANVNIVDDKDRTALSVAREDNKDEIFLFLFERTQIISERDELHKNVLTNGDTLERRRRTFIGFPEELETLVDSLVESGFYYFGLNDTVRCFNCHCSLKHWRSSHDPWVRHAIENPECEFLIQEKGQLFIQTYKRDYRGETVLHWECRRRNVSAVKDLVQKGLSMFAKAYNGWTSMDYAIKSENRELIEYVTSYDLLKTGFGEDVNAVIGVNNRTALHFAAKGNNLSLIERLISEGAYVNSTDLFQQTPLHITYSFNEEDLSKCLIESGGIINVQNADGLTALHSAAWLGNMEMVKSLLELGANPNIVDNEQRTPLSVAREEMKVEMFLFLFERTEVTSERDTLHKAVLTNGDDVDVRRATFVGFPKELPGIVDSLSQSGFYYYGIEDYVRCFKCDQGVYRWEPEDDPWFAHAEYNPKCEFLIREKGLEFVQSCQQNPM